MASNNYFSSSGRVFLYALISVSLIGCAIAIGLLILGFIKPNVDMRYLVQVSNGLQKAFYVLFFGGIASSLICWAIWKLAEFDRLVVWPKFVIGFFIIALLICFFATFVTKSGAIDIVGEEYFLVGRFGRQTLTLNQARSAIWGHIQFLATMNGLFTAIMNSMFIFALRKY